MQHDWHMTPWLARRISQHDAHVIAYWLATRY